VNQDGVVSEEEFRNLAIEMGVINDEGSLE
jgi:hypothetical protein